jgi:amino acid transporter
MTVTDTAHSESGSKGLKTGALGLVATIVIGVASTAPGYSLAASLGFVSDEVGLQAPAIMWLAFVPMGCIAAAYFYLNKADPDCGTTFTWVTRSMGPHSGWLAGWGIIIADLLIMPNLAGVSGSYLFQLFGFDGLAANSTAVTVVGCAFIVAMCWICVTGIELSARTQVALLGTEVTILGIFAVVALYKVYVDEPAGSVKPGLSWVNPFEIGSSSALAAGLVLAVFIYWGWDTAVSVNEESRDANRVPGIAAVASTLILVAIYMLVTVGAQAFGGSEFLAANSDDALSAVAKAVFGDGALGTIFTKLLIISVLTSAAASCQTTILPATRSMLSMGSHKAGPKKMAEIHRRHLTPAWSTWVYGGVSCLWYVLLVLITENTSTDAYGASIAAVGISIAFYYGLTGYACVIYYWRHLFTGVKTFVLVGLLPLFGALVLTWILGKTLVDSFAADYWPGTLLGMGTVFFIGVVLLALGLPLMLVWQAREPSFFRNRIDPVDQRPAPDGTGPSAPPLGSLQRGGR